MGDFFTPWRRKVGVVTLLMALAFMVGWIRSLVIEDEFDFHDFIDVPYGSLPIDGLATFPNSLALYTCSLNTVFETVPIPTPNNSGTRTSDASEFKEDAKGDLQNDEPTVEHRAGVEIEQAPLIEIPFSAIVAPLTFISLWLLLSKPRKSTLKRSIESIPEKVA